MEISQLLELVKNAEEVDGYHFSYYVAEVIRLKKLSKSEELEMLLHRLIQATEAGDNISHWGVAPWYFEELAKLYRKQKNYEREVLILERYAKHRHGPGVKPQKLEDRLIKARILLMRQKQKSNK
jgi:hypothetical protein